MFFFGVVYFSVVVVVIGYIIINVIGNKYKIGVLYFGGIMELDYVFC